MFLDYFLIIFGLVLGGISLSAIVYLIIFAKQSKSYKMIIEQQTKTLDVYAETSKSLKATKSKITSKKATETYGDKHTTEILPKTTEILNDKFQNGTELMPDDISTPTFSRFNESFTDGYREIDGFKISTALLEKYTITDVISGGGMSKTFLALNNKLQNKWFIKFIANEYGSLTSEENILKLLNHTNLPIIADIFYEKDGIYLVQRFIEGFTLEDTLKCVGRLGQSQILQWFEQMAQVLQYLHNIKPNPIIHCDLKPANIMVTHDNNLVLIDFGISKLQNETNADPLALTLRYAAPEQFRFNNPKYANLIAERFGTLPEEHKRWNIDERTDIFSLGTIFFQIITGQTPSVGNTSIGSKGNWHLLEEMTVAPLATIIEKCLEIDPQNRYQNAGELLAEIQKLKTLNISMAKKLTLRRVIFVTMVFTVLMSTSSLASGLYIAQQENLAIIEVDPNILTISEQESAEIIIRKELGGSKENIELSRMSWSFDNNNVRIDGNRIVALNEGVATITGRYRNKIVEFEVNVVQPVDGLVNVSMKYRKGNMVSVFAGNGEFDHQDGYLTNASFMSPESISVSSNGNIFLTDAGLLRKIENGRVETIEIEPAYIRARKVRCHGDDVFMLTSSWTDENDQNRFAIIRLANEETENEEADIVYFSDADFATMNDFTISENGIIYALEYVAVTDAVYLKEINPVTQNVEILYELESSIVGLDIYGDIIYLAGGESGTIMSYSLSGKTLEYLAGIKGEQHFIDGTAPLFYQPKKIKSIGDSLYVLDYNVLRKINLENGLFQSVETVAGEVSTDSNPETISGESSSVIFASSSLMEFDLMHDGSFVLTDPKKGLLRLIYGNDYTAESKPTQTGINYDVSTKNINGITYIQIPYFHMQTYEQVKQIIKLIESEELAEESENTKNIIIDLRNNFGGVLEEAIKTADLFISDGLICSVELKDEPPRYYYAEEKTLNTNVVILINAFTASSAEMLAAAISEAESGILLGTATYGKSSVQITGTNNFKTTVGKYLTRNGNDLSKEPLKPDIEILKFPDTDNQLEQALKEFDSL